MTFEPTPTMWADPASPAFADFDPEDVEMAILSATWICWALSGRSLHSAGRRIETYRIPSTSNGLVRLMSPVDTFELAERFSTCSDDYDGTVITGACCVGSRLRIGPHQDFRPIPISPMPSPVDCETLVRATYTVRSNLPPGTAKAVEYLSLQYIAAWTGEGKCSLPERVNSISRQGMSWTILDPQDFLEAGKTGMIRVDAWLSAVNPSKAKSKARVIHPAEGVFVEGWWDGYEPTPYTHTIDGGSP